MEADWEFEIGPDAPLIDANWTGSIDLRRHPERILELPEAAQFPPLAAALLVLNSRSSPFRTSKCDLWSLSGTNQFDPDELDAPVEAAAHAIACYIDLLPRADEAWKNRAQANELWNAESSPNPSPALAACQRIQLAVRSVPLRGCRVDLVIRRAVLADDCEQTGITAYLTACGSSPEQAKSVLGLALAAFADSVCGKSKLQ